MEGKGKEKKMEWKGKGKNGMEGKGKKWDGMVGEGRKGSFF